MKTSKLFFRIISLIGLFLCTANGFSQDPNFYIYLCFGQSNMEGQATIEAQDQTNVDTRFQVIEAVPCTNLGRTQGSLSTAVPPLCRCTTGLCPADYFGRTMVANLPTNIKVAIINVSVAGCKIELFDKVNFAAYAATVASWMTTIINDYGGNPYGRLVDIAKLAQKVGVIKGILLHQGESNTGDTGWPTKVQGVYNNLITDLGLVASKTPLLVGELRYQDQGGSCYSHNTIIATVPSVIPNSYVISASGLPGSTADTYHFTAAGYRTFGIRYAQQMLALMDPYVTITSPVNNTSVKAPASITINASVKNPNPNGTVTKVDFYNGTTKIGTSTTSPYTYTWTNVAKGTYYITAVATNSNNKTGTSIADTVIVTGTTVSPTVSITSPINNAAFTSPSVVTINATASETGGTISKVEFFNGTTLLGASTTSPYTYSWTNATPGIYSITAVATDNASVKTTSTAVSITVAPAVPTNTTTVSYCQGAPTIALTATGTALKWYSVAAGGTALSTAPIPSSSTVGSTTLYVSQTIGGIESSRSSVTVTVNALPSVPTVVTPVNYTKGASATALTATGSALKWYTALSGGTALSNAPTPLTTTVGSTNYYVSQTINTCESARSLITVNVIAPVSTVSLNEGWNYIGCPLSASTALASALSSIWSNVLIVKNLDVFYSASNVPALNTLTDVQWGHGYYIKVSAACNLDWIAR